MRLYKLNYGDIFFLKCDIKEIQPYIDNNTLKIIETYYQPKKWWQFWKKKKVMGYKVMCILK